MQTKLYHVSPSENTESILKDGLIPYGAFVSLSENPKSWYREGMTVFEVDIDGLNLEMHTWQPQLDEITVWGRIPPERVRVYSMP